MSLSFKPTVHMNGITARCLRGMAAVAEVYDRYGIDLRITSVKDGKHMPTSKHYTGDAFDFGTKELPVDKKMFILSIIPVVLGPDWDFVYEAEGTMNEHGHAEFDRKP